MSDKHVVLDSHTLAYECMTGDLDVLAYLCAFLDLNKCTDLGVVPHLAAIHVDKGENLDSLPELHVGGDALVQVQFDS